MGAGAKGHARVKPNHDVAGLCARLDPTGNHEQAFTQTNRLVMRFPGVGPIFFGHLAHGRLGKGVEHLQVPEGFFCLAHERCGLRALTHIGAHAHQRRGQFTAAVEAGQFHHGARGALVLVGVTVENFADRFCGFAVRQHTDFKPIHGKPRPVFFQPVGLNASVMASTSLSKRPLDGLLTSGVPRLSPGSRSSWR